MDYGPQKAGRGPRLNCLWSRWIEKNQMSALERKPDHDRTEEGTRGFRGGRGNGDLGQGRDGGGRT